MDYMLGTWVARNAKGEVRGKALVQRQFGTCSIRFLWTGKRYDGAATNAFDASRNVWQKAWADSTGYVELSTGHIASNNLEYIGPDYENGHQVDLHREHLTLLPDGRVMFHYEISTDGGRTWPQQDFTYYSRISRRAYDKLSITKER